MSPPLLRESLVGYAVSLPTAVVGAVIKHYAPGAPSPVHPRGG